MSTPQTLDTFTRAYIEAALWSSTDDHGDPMDSNYSTSDIAPEALARIIADCAKFQADNAELLAQCYADNSLPVNSNGRMGGAGSAGHDFWLTRNGHGAGFWDGDWDSPQDVGEEWGKRLTDASKPFGECDLYVGEDGQLYIS